MKKLKIKKGTEYKVAKWSLIAWVIFWLFGTITGLGSFPISYFQKLAFGLFGMSLIMAINWWRMEKTNPGLKKLLDPDNENFKDLELWQQFKVGMFYYGLYAVGTVILAALY